MNGQKMFDGLYYVMDSDSDSDNEIYGKHAVAVANGTQVSRRERRAHARRREQKRAEEAKLHN